MKNINQMFCLTFIHDTFLSDWHSPMTISRNVRSGKIGLTLTNSNAYFNSIANCKLYADEFVELFLRNKKNDWKIVFFIWNWVKYLIRFDYKKYPKISLQVFFCVEINSKESRNQSMHWSHLPLLFGNTSNIMSPNV